ncbi:MAG: SDR family oxidoreductase [Candidatus Woykebacteria bacterium]
MSLTKKETVLITGATGTLGRRIVEEVLKSHSVGKIILLVRGETNKAAGERVSAFIKSSRSKVFDVFASDVTKKDLGLNSEVYNKLSKEVTSIFHCAATVRFSAALEEARLVNYQGNANLLEFANNCRNLSKFGHVSTAFVAGKRKGVIYEDELEHNEGFINPYERSKYEAEILVRENITSLPINIYRPTVLLDNESRNAVNYMFKLFWDESLPIIPGDKKGNVDLISVDYCAFALWRIFDKHFSEGKTYHIASGPAYSYSLGELVEKVAYHFSKRKKLTTPKIINLNEFQTLLLKKLSTTKIGVFKKLNTFATQLLYPKIFNNTSLQELGDKELLPKHVGTYFDQYLEDFLERKALDD